MNGGYSSVADIERDIAEAINDATEAEKKIEIAKANISDEYSFEKAISIYRSESNVASRVDSIYPEAAFIIAMHQKNKSITFGRFVQKKKHPPEPIEWLIVKQEYGRFLLLSKYGLDCREYGFGRKPVNNYESTESWETSSIREWLNGAFLETAFSDKEREIISETLVSLHETRGDKFIRAEKRTADHVFLLSFEEIKEVFGEGFISAKDIKCVPTDYASSHGKSIWRTCEWWLRTGSVGHVGRCESPHAFSITENGGMGFTYDGKKILVRPALWIDIKS